MGKYLFLILTDPDKDDENRFRVFNALLNAVEFKNGGHEIALWFASFGLQAFLTKDKEIQGLLTKLKDELRIPYSLCGYCADRLNLGGALAALQLETSCFMGGHNEFVGISGYASQGYQILIY